MTNNDLQTKIVATCMSGFIVILVIISIASNHALHEKNQRLQRDLDWYHTNYLEKNGGTSLWTYHREWVDYNLKSFDGGKTWYATHRTTNDEVVIDGLAEKIYPGLMKSLNDWDNIVKYAEQHGPINPNTAEGLNVLESNGFTIRRTAN